MQSVFSRVEWELLEQRNNFNLLKHRTTFKVIQQYTLFNVSEQDKTAWGKRLKIKHDNVLEVLGCQLFSNLDIGDWKQNNLSMRVYMDSTSQRLSQLRNVTRDQQLQLILPVLKGFEKLYQQYGSFKISSSLIGLNLQRQVKVWKSANFLDNKGDFISISQQQMVMQILGLFRKLIHLDQCAKSFKQAVYLVNNIKTNHVPRRKPISDLISTINKSYQNQFQLRSSYQIQSKKPSFSKRQKIDCLNNTIRQTLKINSQPVESDHHRKTSKNITQIIQQSTNKNKIDIRSQLFDCSRTIDNKLQLIEQYLSTDKESSSSRLCIIYRYAYYNDTQMLSQLQIVNGKIIDIMDIKMLQRITQIIDKQTTSFVCQSFKKTRSPRVSLIDIEKIKKKAFEEYKEHQFQMNVKRQQKTHSIPMLTKIERIQQAKLMKNQAQVLLFD